ncbi:MAG: hypothetical protein RQM95_12790 [Syntrophaceticus schinkii]
MFKRRQARQRAESRKVEGIELRNSANGKADSFRPEEGNISAGDRGEQAGTSPESKTLARCTQLVHGNLGDLRALPKKEYGRQANKVRKPKGAQGVGLLHRPMKQGNSCRGKAVAESLPLEEEH